MTSITATGAKDFSVFDGGDYTKITGIASSANGAIVYVSINNNSGVVKSVNGGSTWNSVFPNFPFNSIACSSDGAIVYAVLLGTGLYKSTDAGNTFNLVTFSPSNALPGGAANPEITDASFNGYNLTNMYQVACDSTGSKLIMTTNAAASIYQSINGGVTWSFLYAKTGYSTNPNNPIMVASNSDGTVLYAALNTNTIKNIITSTDSGVTWSNMNMFGLVGPFASLATNSIGDFLYSVSAPTSSNYQLNTFYPTHADNAVLVAGSGNTYVALATNNDGNNIIIAQNNFPEIPPYSITNGAVVFYSVTNKYTPGQSGSVPCFKDDSKILCFKEGCEQYVKVQDIRKGDLVKTLKHGYVPVNMIGTTKLYNSGDMLRGPNRLYICSVDKYPELIEDLVITGFHSILEDNISEKQKEETIELVGNIMITDNKYRLMACLDERATPYLEEGIFNIWHIALDNNDYYMNYGIYANGLLVETCSKRYLKELSGMILIE